MATGAVDTSDDFSVSSDADGEAVTSFNATISDETREYALCVGQGGDL